jgi:glucan phosphoethanolaminetransferase (alkaline phosphatase superfamily)
MKNKKSNKTIIIVSLVLILLLAVALVVCLFVIPDQTRHYIKTAWDWLNYPLPIVGVSTLMVIILIWKIFVNTSFGKKQINEFKRNAQETKDNFDNLLTQTNKEKAELIEIINQYKKELDTYKEYLSKICEAIPNKQVKLIGAELNERKETIDN